MKKQLVASLICLLAFSALAVAQSFQPYFGMENVDAVAQPVVTAGAIVEGTLGNAWSIALDVGYEDPNALAIGDPWNINFGVDIGFDQVATVNATGVIKYGASFEFTHTAAYEWGAYPSVVVFGNSTSTGFMATGYVGPLSLWGGATFVRTKNAITTSPTIGFEVLFDFPL